MSRFHSSYKIYTMFAERSALSHPHHQAIAIPQVELAAISWLTENLISAINIRWHSWHMKIMFSLLSTVMGILCAQYSSPNLGSHSRRRLGWDPPSPTKCYNRTGYTASGTPLEFPAEGPSYFKYGP